MKILMVYAHWPALDKAFHHAMCAPNVTVHRINRTIQQDGNILKFAVVRDDADLPQLKGTKWDVVINSDDFAEWLPEAREGVVATFWPQYVAAELLARKGNIAP